MALVLVSAVEHHGPGAASPGAVAIQGDRLIATVEHIEKVTKDEKMPWRQLWLWSGRQFSLLPA